MHLDEWLHDYDVEQSCYNSLALEAEVKLRRAQVFTANMEYPSALQTAVAFEVFDAVARVCGRYKVRHEAVIVSMRPGSAVAVCCMAWCWAGVGRDHLSLSPSMAFAACGQDVLLKVKSVMLDSVYVNADELDGSDRSVTDYYRLSPFFNGSKAWGEESLQLKKTIVQLRDVIVGMERNRHVAEHDIKHASRTVGVWQYVGVLAGTATTPV